MPHIQRPADEKAFDVNGRMMVPSMEIPSFRKLVAMDRGALNKFMITVRGGLGDAICSEPAIRYACKNFKSEIFLATDFPELFQHLPVTGIFDLKVEHPNWIDYLNFRTLATVDELQSEFMTHMYSHVVDYHSLLMWRVQLPPKDKSIVLKPHKEAALAANLIDPSKDILIHAGRTWESRTFPKVWWDSVTFEIQKGGMRPVLIGAEASNGCGTVNLSNDGCFDLRGKLSVMQTVAVCQKARAIITNDSSPLHMAASGDAFIAFASTVKEPSLLMHWRHEQYGWKMRNFSKDWLCNHLDTTPTNTALVEFNKGDVHTYLPHPSEIVYPCLAELTQKG